jgi:hypothetical protein
VSDNPIRLESSDILPAIFQLLQEQQRVSERTGELVESIVRDISRLREQSERIAILTNRMDGVEKAMEDFNEKRMACLENVAKSFRMADEKRERNKDKIIEISQQFSDQCIQIREQFSAKIQVIEKDCSEKIRGLESQITTTREKVAYSAGGYGAIAAILASLISFLLQHLIKGK